MERIVIVYERVSTERQDLSRQAVQRERASEENPGAEVEVIQDDGTSAFHVPIFDRPGGKRLVEAIADGTVAAVYADSQDRLSRGKLAEWVNFKALCDENRTRVVVNGREIKADDEADEILSVVEAIRARRESLEKAHRARGGSRMRAQRGQHNGGPRPYGYVYPEGGGPLTPAPGEADVVRRIFAEWNAGTSQKEIARRLNADGVVPRRGGRWVQPSVGKIISNPVYAGQIRHRGTVYDGEHAPLITEDTWSAAQALREATARTKGGGRGRPSSGRHLFTRGMLKCGACGGSMVPRTLRARSENGRSYEAYLCANRIADKESCQQTPVMREDIDSAFFRYFESVALDVDATRAHFAGEQSRRLSESGALRDEARRDESRAAERLARVKRDYQDGRLDADDWNDQRAELTAELEGARAKLARLEAQAKALATEALPDAEAAVLEYLTDLRAAVVGRVAERNGLDTVRAAVATMFERFTLHRLDGPTGPPVAVEALVTGAYFLEPVVAANMVARVVAVHPASGEPLAVEPLRMPLQPPAHKDNDGGAR
jgi:DNA invertase Pin-like site-specific DNA recombinase